MTPNQGNFVEIDGLFESLGYFKIAGEVRPFENIRLTIEGREMIESAEIIVGVAREDGHGFLVFGRDKLQAIAKSGREESLYVLRVGLDQETDDLEKLCAVVKGVKGKHDYEY